MRYEVVAKGVFDGTCITAPGWYVIDTETKIRVKPPLTTSYVIPSEAVADKWCELMNSWSDFIAGN